MIEALLYVLAGIGLLQVIYACLPIQVSFWILEKVKGHIEKSHDKTGRGL